METLRSEVAGLLIPGEELVVAGAIALPGTVILLQKKEAYLASFFSDTFLQESAELFSRHSIYRGETAFGLYPAQEHFFPFDGQIESVSGRGTVPWQLAEHYGADALLEAGEGGILAALWKIAEASQTGLNVDLRKIPVRQETIEICERLDVNPYKLFSRGCLLAGMKNGTAFVNECCRRGFYARIIGETNSKNDRLLYSRENVRYLERPGKDELSRFL